jgi:hypothetical protein
MNFRRLTVALWMGTAGSPVILSLAHRFTRR